MAIAELARAEAVVGESDDAIRLTSKGRRLGMRFTKGGLTGTWAIDPVRWPECLDDLDALYDSLKGEVALTDDDSTALVFSVSPVGRIHIHLWINGHCAFGIEPNFDLDFGLEQTLLPALVGDLRKVAAEMSAMSVEAAS